MTILDYRTWWWIALIGCAWAAVSVDADRRAAEEAADRARLYWEAILPDSVRYRSGSYFNRTDSVWNTLNWTEHLEWHQIDGKWYLIPVKRDSLLNELPN